jgi:uncharacterized protein YbjT (DUF2867 family)
MLMSDAIVIGATGLVGKCLVRQLLDDSAYERVVVLARRSTETRHPKYEEHVVDFESPAAFSQWVRGNVLFSCLGTTRRQAGSVAAQRRVDYDYQLEVATMAAQNGVRCYVLVSSSGANERSLSAYMKMKGELELAVQALPFDSIQILRPGLLVGEREQSRLGEAISERALHVLNAVGLARSLQPISGDQVAAAMRRVAMLPGRVVHQPQTLFG